ncbi:hypothetical protein AAKU55_005714 [Oxalobacteraceae bacterium GrIS 1.11]
MDNDSWLNDRVTFLKALKTRTEQQELIVLLSENTKRSPLDTKKLAALVKAEKASIRANKARQDAANLINAEKKTLATAARNARTHELCESAGLMGLAGLVDTLTGKPTIDRGELLGALLGLAKVPADDSRRADWKRAGDTLLAKTA